MPKSHSYLSSKIIFNYLPAVILIRSSFDFIKGKVWKPISDFMTQLISHLLSQHHHQYFELFYCLELLGFLQSESMYHSTMVK